MFYRIKFLGFVAFLGAILSLDAHAQGLELFSEETIAPPKVEDKETDNKKEEVSAELAGIDVSLEKPQIGPIKKTIEPKKVEEKAKDAKVDVKKAMPVKAIGETPSAMKPAASIKAVPKKATNAGLNAGVDAAAALGVETNEDVKKELAEVEKEMQELLDEKAVNDTLKEYANDEIFSKMSELEKEAALLTLQLKREQIQNDIEAVKNQREAAEAEEIARKEALEEKKRDIVQEKQKALLKEQQKLKDLEIAYEKVRQEKLLAKYKEEMLLEKQELLNRTADLYKEIKTSKEDTYSFITDLKSKFLDVKKKIDSANTQAIRAKSKKETEIANLKTQMSVLQSQLKAAQAQNPFEIAKDKEARRAFEQSQKLENTYAIMEIRGKDGKLIAKIINKEGQTFLAQVGTELQTGHVVEEITETYLKANKDGVNDYVYFASGGILDKEPLVNKALQKSMEEKIGTPAKTSGGNSRSGVVKPAAPVQRTLNVYSG